MHNNIMNIIRPPHILVIQLYPMGGVNGVSSHTQHINTKCVMKPQIWTPGAVQVHA